MVRVPHFSLEDFPGRRPGGFTSPDLTSPGFVTISPPDLRAASPHRVFIETRQSRIINRSVHQLRTNPERINLSQESLDLRRPGFSPGLSLLMLAESLPGDPVLLTVHLRFPRNALLPRALPKKYASVTSVPCFSPVGLSAPGSSTSELLRFL